MATPISSDKILPPSGEKANRPDEKTGRKAPDGLAGADQKAGPGSTPAVAENDPVDVARASQLYHRSNSVSSESSRAVQTPEQAVQLAAELQAQFKAGGSMALQAQSGIVPDHVDRVLNSVPR